MTVDSQQRDILKNQLGMAKPIILYRHNIDVFDSILITQYILCLFNTKTTLCTFESSSILEQRV